MELSDQEIKYNNTAVFKIVKLTVDCKLDARKINIKSVISYLQGMNIDTSDTKELNFKNDLQFLALLGIIFMEKDDTQHQTMIREYKNKFIKNLTNPPPKMIEYKGG